MSWAPPHVHLAGSWYDIDVAIEDAYHGANFGKEGELMSVFAKSLQDYFLFVRTGLILLLAVGVARFILGVSGVPYDRITHLVSMSILTLVLAVIYGQQVAARAFGGYRHLLVIASLLSVTMYGFIILAILVEGLGGIHGIFHAPGAGNAPMGMGIGQHIVGQLMVMVVFAAVLWGLASLGYVMSRYLGYLRNAFLLLAAMFVLRVVVGALGVPYAVGTWLTSLTLLAMVLAVYYGYLAPSRGFQRYPQMLLMGVLLGAGLTLLVIYGIGVTEGLGIANYFHAPGEGLQPAGMTPAQLVAGHFQVSVMVMIFMAILAMVGFALGKRKAGEPATQPV